MGSQGSKPKRKLECKVVKHKTNEMAKQKNTRQMGLQSSNTQNKWDCKAAKHKANGIAKQ